MRPERFLFRREDRLRDKQLISKIFNREGERLQSWPLSLFYLHCAESVIDSPAQVMFVIPKKKIRKQVQRQSIKRQLRELYRLKKPELYERIGHNRHFAMVWFYAGSAEFDAKVLEHSFNRIYHEFIKSL
jgi:ribonuclease P protein component